jgi:hypothetical protein
MKVAQIAEGEESASLLKLQQEYDLLEIELKK